MGGSERKPRFSDKENMPYTMAAVYEVLRYMLLRCQFHTKKRKTKTSRDSLLLRTVLNRQITGSFIMIPYFGRNLRFFKPERFLDEHGNLIPLNDETRSHLVAFSTGHRECPAGIFGRSRVFLYLVTVLQSFDILSASDGQLPDTDPRSYTPGIDLRVKSIFV